MKTKVIVLLAVLLIFSSFQYSNEKESKFSGIDFTVGLHLSHSLIPVKIDKLEDDLTLFYAALGLEAEFSEYLTVGALIGYGSNSMKDPVNFYKVPLTLQLNDTNFKSMLLGFIARSEFFSWKDFTFHANAEFMHFMKAKNDFLIYFDTVDGSGKFQNSLTRISLEMLAQYEGLSNFDLFAGPQLFLLKGKFNTSETIGNISGEEELSYKQRKSLGLVSGIHFEAGDFEIQGKVTLFSNTSISALISYTF